MSHARRTATLIAAIAVPALGPTLSLAHQDDHHHAHEPVRVVPYTERYAPSLLPDRIVLTWADDPKTTQAVTWRTSTEAPQGAAQIAPAGHGPRFTGFAKTHLAETHLFTTDLGDCHMHTVNFTGLEPGTIYAYRVGDGANWTEWFQFRTEPADIEPFSFVYFGDAQNSVRSMWSRITREAFRDAPRAAFFLHAGDLVNRADSDGEWGEWFEAGSFINATIPVIATPGNHEYHKGEGVLGFASRQLTAHFPATFAFPENGPEDLQSSVYYIDYADTRIISLNSNEHQTDQIPWLDKVLQDNDRRWTVVTFHHPVFAMAERRSGAMLRAIWKPLFDKHRVDIVLNGHDHTYGRTQLIGPGDPGVPMLNTNTGVNARSESGTVYVVSVSGPKMYAAKDRAPVDVARRAEDTQLYQIITIDGDELSYEARTAVGELYDAFTLRKRTDGPNELIEHDIAMPERRR